MKMSGLDISIKGGQERMGSRGGIANFDIPRRWRSWLKSEPEALLLQIFRLVRLGQSREEKCDVKLPW